METILLLVITCFLFFCFGFALEYYELKSRVKNGLVPFIDASGEVSWKEK